MDWKVEGGSCCPQQAVGTIVSARFRLFCRLSLALKRASNSTFALVSNVFHAPARRLPVASLASVLSFYPKLPVFPCSNRADSSRVYLVGGGLLRHSGRTLTEAVLETTLDVLQVAHAASARRAATQGLLTPVELAHLSSGVATRRAGALLDVVRAAPTPSTDGVGLVVAHTETLRTFRLHLTRNTLVSLLRVTECFSCCLFAVSPSPAASQLHFKALILSRPVLINSLSVRR